MINLQQSLVIFILFSNTMLFFQDIRTLSWGTRLSSALLLISPLVSAIAVDADKSHDFEDTARCTRTKVAIL